MEVAREQAAARGAPPPAAVPPAPTESAVRQQRSATPSLPPLIARIAVGEQAALRELYDCTAAKLMGFAFLFVKNSRDAEEILCDVYLQVWQSPLKYDAARGSVLAWLLGICRARAIDRCRRNRTRAFIGSPADAPGSDDGSVACEPCGLLQKLEEGSAVRRALERLSPTRRWLLSLAFFQGLSHEEISIETRLPVGTVKSHIRRALGALRAELGPEADANMRTSATRR